MPATVGADRHGDAFLQADRDVVGSATMKFGLQEALDEAPAPRPSPSASRAQFTSIDAQRQHQIERSAPR